MAAADADDGFAGFEAYLHARLAPHGRPAAAGTGELLTLGTLFAVGNTLGWGNTYSIGKSLVGWGSTTLAGMPVAPVAAGGGSYAPLVTDIARGVWGAVSAGRAGRAAAPGGGASVQALGAAGAATDVAQLAADVRRSGSLVVPLFLLILTACLEYAGHTAKEEHRRRQAARGAEPDAEDWMTRQWLARESRLDPVGAAMNVLVGLVRQLQYAVGANPGNPMAAIWATVDTLGTWQALATLLQVYDLAPLQLASGALAVAFARAPPAARPPPRNIWARLRGAPR